MMKENRLDRLWLLPFFFLLLFFACPVSAVTEVSGLEPSGNAAGTLETRFLGGNWDTLQNALIEARKNGETEVTVKLNHDTYRDFADSDHIWYYAARAGVQNADCTYWSDRRVRLSNISWWPRPMYLVRSREEYIEAVRLQKSGRDFGVLPDEGLFAELLEDDRTRDRLEYRGGLTGYENLYYGEDTCAIWYTEPTVEETVYLEVSGFAEAARALRETVCGHPRARIVLALDDTSYERLNREEDLRDDVLSMAGFCSGYRSNDRARAFIFPVAEEACYPGFLIAEFVRLRQEKDLSLLNKLTLAKARELVREVEGTDLEKATQIHDLLCRHITYTVDENSEEDDCCTGALLNGRANCDGYADAFLLCASLCGLTVRYMAGESVKDTVPEEGAGHLWNLILLDGSWRSIDVTWDDQEEDGVSYEYFNLGLDRMEKEYVFTREMLPAPFAGTTDLQARPVREWTAETREDLQAAVEEILSSGRSEAVIRFSEELFDQYLEDSGVVAYAVASAGAEAETIWYSVSNRTITLEGVKKLSPWVFCRTREETAQAIGRMREAGPFYLTFERDLFSELFTGDRLAPLYALMAKGGLFNARLSWNEGSRTLTVLEPEWLEGYYAEDISGLFQLNKAVRDGMAQGYRNFYLFFTEKLYRELTADSSFLYRVVRDSGYRDSWSYYPSDENCSIYIVADR